jgi:hypothetical protein
VNNLNIPGLSTSVADFLSQVIVWATGLPDILGVALVGSYARGSAKPDSDVDLVIIAEKPQCYLTDQLWASEFGPVKELQIEDFGMLTSLRVWYASGLEVEYGFTDARWVAVPLDPGTQQVIKHGLHILYERRPLFSIV